MILNNSFPVILHVIALLIVGVIILLAFRKTVPIPVGPKINKKPTARVVVAISVLVYLGGLAGINYAQNQKKEEKLTLLLSSAKSVAEGLSYRTFSEIQFTQDDLTNPLYYSVCNQLKAVSSVLDNLNIYTMVLRDSQIVFGPESIERESPLASLPGEVYLIPPRGLFNVFKTGHAHVTGPYEDEYGKFISAFYPAFQQNQSLPYLVIGVDLQQKNWESMILEAGLIPLAITCLLLLLLLGSLYILTHPKIIMLRRSVWWQSPEAILTFSGVTLLWVIIICTSVSVETRYRQNIFNQTAAVKAGQFRSYMQIVESHLWRISDELSNLTNINPEDFRRITSPFREVEYTILAGWAADTAHQENRSKNLIIQDTEPTRISPFRYGSSIPELSDITYQLLDSTIRARMLSSETQLSLPSTISNAMIVYVPFDLQADTGNNGLFFILIDPDRLLKRALMVAGPREDNLFNFSLEAVDTSGETHQLAHFGDNSEMDRRFEKIHSTHYMFIFGKSYQLQFYPEELFFKTHPKIALPLFLPIAIIFTVLLTILVGFLSTRKSRLEKEVEKRTLDLNRSEHRFLSLYNAMSEGVAFHKVIRDTSGRITDYLVLDVNPSYSRITSLSKNDVTGKRASVLYEQNPAPFLDLYASVTEQQKETHIEEYYAPMGRYFDISAIPIRKDTFATIFSDITPRVLSEKAIKESEEKYRMISENVADIIWMMDIEDQHFTYVSPSVYRICGYKVEEALDMKLEEILTPESLKHISVALPERIAKFEAGDINIQSKTIPLDQIKKDGKVIHTEVTTTLLTDDYGKVKEILGVTRDVTEMVKAREALRKNEENFRLLIENQNDLVIKVDLEGRYLYASPTFCQTVGKSEKELLGTAYIPQIDERDVIASLHALEKLKEPPYKIRFEQRIITTSGWRWISWNNNTVFQNGQPVAYIGIGRDVTRQKEYEIKLEVHQEKLQDQNKEYIALNEDYQTINDELHHTNNQLTKAIERAQESDNLKTAFLQNMSHEIRTPLNAIIGFSEMLTLPGFDKKERSHFAETIVNSSRELLNLVNDILTISTLEARQERVNRKKVVLKELFDELEAIFKNTAIQKRVDLQQMFPDSVQDDFFLLVDELKLKQIFNNLIGNALKFTDKGTVAFGFELNDSSDILFHVKDTGIGIEPHLQETIFNRFSQAGPEIQKKYGGTGLGLAICKGHVELMGGNIWLESTPGKGSVFYFKIPRRTGSTLSQESEPSNTI